MPMPPLSPRTAAWVVLGLLATNLAPAARAADEPTPSIAAAADVARPGNGMKMSDVESRFGAPATRHEAVGEPPITRWDYPAFAVFFERDLVLHAVLAQALAPSSD
jgi:hypothetical protein